MVSEVAFFAHNELPNPQAMTNTFTNSLSTLTTLITARLLTATLFTSTMTSSGRSLRYSEHGQPSKPFVQG